MTANKPTKGEIENLRDKFMVAVHAMAESDAPLRERLAGAMVTVMSLREDEMPDEKLRGQFHELVESATRVEVPRRDGQLSTTLEHMSPEQLRSAAELLCRIHEGLTDAVDQDGAPEDESGVPRPDLYRQVKSNVIDLASRAPIGPVQARLLAAGITEEHDQFKACVTEELFQEHALAYYARNESQRREVEEAIKEAERGGGVYCDPRLLGDGSWRKEKFPTPVRRALLAFWSTPRSEP